ncbi:hypothetical protein AMECASPLE_012650 [Ameca splendens]|uniref:Uncharacterized protein n=1 Tax=Ameca splendens TaxID=208324 RepID=A0ABV0XE77_9TELE
MVVIIIKAINTLTSISITVMNTVEMEQRLYERQCRHVRAQKPFHILLAGLWHGFTLQNTQACTHTHPHRNYILYQSKFSVRLHKNKPIHRAEPEGSMSLQVSFTYLTSLLVSFLQENPQSETF